MTAAPVLSPRGRALQRVTAAVLELDRAVDGIEEVDLRPRDLWSLEPDRCLLSIASDRYDEVVHCLKRYGRPTAPAPIPLVAGEVAAR